MSSSTQDSQSLDSGSGEETLGPGIERKIGHDEFDPTGTLALIAIYFLIIAGLWIFVYFVEFLGNGPTVV